MKRIAILTSGGDAPGMNAAVRAAVRYGIYCGMEVVGVERGYAGLIESNFIELGLRSVSDIIHRGGTILRTARCPEFKTPEGQALGIKNLKEHGIEGLIVIGGDGSFMGAKVLSEKGFPTIGIPGTIDNDLAYTDYTLGFDTACNTILDAINKIRDTMSSHERISIVEVMGRNCGKRSGIVVLAEGAGHADELMKELNGKTDLHIRSTVLGHIQRGGSPSNQDRYLGTCFGSHAVKLLQQGIGNRIVGIRDNKIYDIDIVEGLALKRKFNTELYELASVVAR